MALNKAEMGFFYALVCDIIDVQNIHLVRSFYD